jgi:CheY-like chemotaxis protein
VCSDNEIGMSVVKGFTELMGGKLSVESKEGDGSTFTVDIPFSTASEKQQKMASHPVIDGMDAGMNGYIPKPVSIKDIKEAFKENY